MVEDGIYPMGEKVYVRKTQLLNSVTFLSKEMVVTSDDSHESI